MSRAATQYPYTSLKPVTSIRLFRVKPELSNGYVSCTLRQFDGKEFDDIVSKGKECDGTECNGERCYGTICHGKVPAYSALSYVWGDSKHTQKIYLGGYLIGVHETLWEFLHQMQTTQKSKTWFWTDYLCLNQADQTEMSEQVQRMGEIYSEAKETLAWLGRDGSPAAQRVEDSTPVKNLEVQLALIAERVDLKRTAVERFFAELPNWTAIIRYSLSEELEAPADQDLPQASREVIQLGHGKLWVQNSLEDVLSLPYWTRIWIVQEVARAKAVKLTFGSVSINFDDFILAYKSYAYYAARKTIPGVGWTIPGSKAAIEARVAVTENSLSMRQVLQWSTICQASRPVDQVYGLFGLLKSHGTGTSSNLESLTVDYNKDVMSVFWEVVFSVRILTVGNEEERFLKSDLDQFMNSVPLLADSLGWPQAFSPQGLSCYSGTVQDHSLRRMAQLTSRMVHVFRQTGGGLKTDPSDLCYWKPTRDPARKTRPDRPGKLAEFELEMAALFLEYAEFDDVGESGEVHAAYIASKLAEMAKFSGEWICKPVHNHPEDDRKVLTDGRMRRKEYQVFWERPMLAHGSGRFRCCSLPDIRTSPAHSEKHQCSGSSLFLCLPDPGFSLRLNLDLGDWTTGTLIVTVNGHMR